MKIKKPIRNIKKCIKSEEITIKDLQNQFNKQKEIQMAAIDNLNTAVANLTTEITKANTAIAALKAGGGNDVAIQSAADAITAQTAALDKSIS